MRSEQRLFQAWREHRLLNATNHVLFELDYGGRWTFLNRAWTKLSGFDSVETLGSHFCDAFHTDDQATAQAILQQAQDGAAAQAIMRLQTPDVVARWVSVELGPAPAMNGSSAGLAGALSDASTLRALEEQVRGRLVAQQEARERRLWFALRVAQEFASGKPHEELYEWFVSSLNNAFHYQITRLYDYDAAAEAAVLVASSEREQRMPSGVLPARAVDDEIVTMAIRQGRTVIVDDLDAKDPPGDGVCHMAMPLRLADELLGIMVVSGTQDEVLDDETVASLGGIAGVLSAAMDNASLRQKMAERKAELENLQRLMRRESWLRTPESMSSSIRGYRFDRGRMDAIEAEEGAEILPLAPDGEKATRTTPLEVRGQSFGILGVEDDPENPLTPDDLALLEAVSTQVSEAMENARLLEQTQKRAVELETVSRVSTATSTILEKDKLLRGVVELTKRSFNLYHAHIYLLDAERGELILAAGSGEAGQQMVEDGWHIDLDEPRSIVAQAARSRKGIIVNDVRKETGFLPNPLLPHTRAELAVPMISGNRLLGVLDVQSDRLNAFTDDDARIQAALAGQVSTALQNATLYQEQLETAEKLREFDRLKSEFLASMSHELRTPLNSVIGFADVLLEGIDGELNERMREDVQLIRNSGQHLRELIGDILDMSKIEAGMMDLRYETVEIEGLRHEIEGFARTQLMAYDKTLDFRMRVASDVTAVEADLTRFKQVLYNLISNAIKFTSDGSVTLSMIVDENDLVVQVEDTGIGITEQDIPIIFEQFRQVDGSLTRSAGGTGLGLPISKSLVELHGGRIWVESVVGEGTSFYFTIPLERQYPRRKHGTQASVAPPRENGSDSG